MILDIFGAKYKVIRPKKMAAEQIGLCDNENKTISVRRDLNGDEYTKVLVHEIVHAVINRVSIDQGKLSHDLEEILCGVLSTALVENFMLKGKSEK